LLSLESKSESVPFLSVMCPSPYVTNVSLPIVSIIMLKSKSPSVEFVVINVSLPTSVEFKNGSGLIKSFTGVSS